MIISYLEKLHKEYLDEQCKIEKELSDLRLQLKEKIESSKLVEESFDSGYEAFTPRTGNGDKNLKKELELCQENLECSIEEHERRYGENVERLDELSSLIKEGKRVVGSQNKRLLSDEYYCIHLLEMQENERQRISRDLHDSTVQSMTSLVHKTELCAKLVSLDPIRCRLELNTITKTLREIIDDTRQMIYNLHPMSFDDIGLDVTIERTLEKLERSQAKKIHFYVKGDAYPVKPVIGITLLRIIQEACSNSICHADPTLIQVILRYEDNKISVMIEDDGKGFDAERADWDARGDNSGFGLSMMKERVNLLSGKIDINSKINLGTKIVVEVPITNKEER